MAAERRARGKQSGRTQEIQRLIGRSLRAVVDLKKLGERQITLDCDVIQADGGTRTASISGAWVALRLAVNGLMEAGEIKEDPITSPGRRDFLRYLQRHAGAGPRLSRRYDADADANFVLLTVVRSPKFKPPPKAQPMMKKALLRLLRLARIGCDGIFAAQLDATKA